MICMGRSSKIEKMARAGIAQTEFRHENQASAANADYRRALCLAAEVLRSQSPAQWSQPTMTQYTLHSAMPATGFDSRGNQSDGVGRCDPSSDWSFSIA